MTIPIFPQKKKKNHNLIGKYIQETKEISLQNLDSANQNYWILIEQLKEDYQLISIFLTRQDQEIRQKPTTKVKDIEPLLVEFREIEAIRQELKKDIETLWTKIEADEQARIEREQKVNSYLLGLRKGKAEENPEFTEKEFEFRFLIQQLEKRIQAGHIFQDHLNEKILNDLQAKVAVEINHLFDSWDFESYEIFEIGLRRNYESLSKYLKHWRGKTIKGYEKEIEEVKRYRLIMYEEATEYQLEKLTEGELFDFLNFLPLDIKEQVLEKNSTKIFENLGDKLFEFLQDLPLNIKKKLLKDKTKSQEIEQLIKGEEFDDLFWNFPSETESEGSSDSETTIAEINETDSRLGLEEISDRSYIDINPWGFESLSGSEIPKGSASQISWNQTFSEFSEPRVSWKGKAKVAETIQNDRFWELSAQIRTKKREVNELSSKNERLTKTNQILLERTKYLKKWCEQLLKITEGDLTGKERDKILAEVHREITRVYSEKQSLPPATNWKQQLQSPGILTIWVLSNFISGQVGYTYGNVPLMAKNAELQTQLNNQSLTVYQGLDNNGNPIFTNATHSQIEPKLNNPATDFLQKIEKEILEKKKREYNITGDIDDYLKQSHPNLTEIVQKAVAENNQEWEEKGLVDLEEVKANIAVAETERDIWKKQYYEIVEKLEKVETKPSDLPNDWQAQLAELAKLKKQPPTTLTKTITAPTKIITETLSPETITHRETATKTLPTETITQKETLTPPTITSTATITKSDETTITKTTTQAIPPTNLPLDWEVKLNSIPKLRRKINHLNNTLTKLATEKTNLNSTNQNLTQALRELEDNNILYKNKITELQAINDKLQNEVDKILELETKLNDRPNITLERYQELLNQEKEHFDILLEKNSKIANLTSELNTKTNELDKLEQKIVELTNTTSEIFKLEENIKALQDQLTRTELVNKDLSEAIDKLTEPETARKISSQSWQQKERQAGGISILTLLGKYLYDKKKRSDLESDKVRLETEKQQAQDKVNELHQQINSHQCPSCLLTHLDGHICKPCSHSDYEQLKKHVCPANSCSETDHQAIRLEWEKQRLAEDLLSKTDFEKSVLNQINTECQLGCATDSNLDQVISRIKELISTPGGEYLTTIIQLEKETMGELLSPQLFTTYSKQLSQITDYQQLANHRQAIIKAQLAENQQIATVNPSESLINSKTILAGSLIITLLTMGGILILKSRRNKNLGSLSARNSLGKRSFGEAKGVSPAVPTLQQINRYLLANGIKSLEVDEEGKMKVRFKVKKED